MSYWERRLAIINEVIEYAEDNSSAKKTDEETKADYENALADMLSKKADYESELSKKHLFRN